MSQFGITLSHNILGKEIVLTDGKHLELVSVSDEGKEKSSGNARN